MAEPDDQICLEVGDEIGKSPLKLKLNRSFAKNIVKYTQDNNRIRSNIQLNEQRKFLNEERKKHTKKNLSVEPNKSKTMYSDYVSQKLGEKTARKNSVMFDQMKKLVKEAAQYDEAMSKKEIQTLHGSYLGNPRKPKISVDKTLLRNHLQHTSVHNRLKEENEMWDKRIENKKRQEKRKPRFGMYADMEPGNSVTVRLSNDSDGEYEYTQRSNCKRNVQKKKSLYSDRPNQDDDELRSANTETAKRKGRVVSKVSSRKVLVSDEIHPHRTIETTISRKRKHMEDEENRLSNGIVPTRSLYADSSEIYTKKSQGLGEKWGHDGFFSLSGDQKKSYSNKKPVYTISSDEDSDNRKKGRNRLSSKVIKNGDKGPHVVSRDTLRGSLHEVGQKLKSSADKSRLVYSKNVKKKRRKYSSSSSSLSSSPSTSDSSDSSSRSSSSSKDSYVPKKKSKKRVKKKKR